MPFAKIIETKKATSRVYMHHVAVCITRYDDPSGTNIEDELATYWIQTDNNVEKAKHMAIHMFYQIPVRVR